ncbi:MAG: Lrp/AsnC family transcriptional regulator [Candidatus Bathyarchaeia archaeon]
MATEISLKDEEWVIKGPHYYLIRRRSLDDLEREAYTLLKESGSMPLSAIWRKLDCHLWEAVAALRRLKEKGLVEEFDAAPEAYKRQTKT